MWLTKEGAMRKVLEFLEDLVMVIVIVIVISAISDLMEEPW